jgi:hypothetical protein
MRARKLECGISIPLWAGDLGRPGAVRSHGIAGFKHPAQKSGFEKPQSKWSGLRRSENSAGFLLRSADLRAK